MLATRVLAEFGDDRERYSSAKARKNYAATSPITRQSGKKKTVAARFVQNDRLVDALARQAQGALVALSAPGVTTTSCARAETATFAAVRQVANRLVGTLHGCLKNRTPYDETTAWGPPTGPR